jgi:hypothetical protein
MHLRRAASLWVATLISATGAVAELKGERVPPSFTVQEIELINRDARVAGAAKRCAWQIRRALDAISGKAAATSRVGEPEPTICPPGTSRASDEGALDIMKILKEAEKGTSRSAEMATQDGSPLFTADELEIIQKDKSGRLTHALRHCGWQLRRAFDTQRHGVRDWPPQGPCWPTSGAESTGRSAEGALDILKILREASGDSK